MKGICKEDLRICALAVDRVRARLPRVHCITNSVVQNLTANMLLAFGAVPSMTINPLEIAAFVGGADALLINLGTVDGDREAAIPVALQTADANGLPVVLDPVFIDRSPARATFAGNLLRRNPAIVRANRSEWRALIAEHVTAEPADSFHESLADYMAAMSSVTSAAGLSAVVTGAQDFIAGEGKSCSFSGGHPWMAMVTGVGCGQAAIMAALAACAETPFHAALAGLLIFGFCGERAATVANGPGSFEPALLDELHKVTGADIAGWGGSRIASEGT